MKIGDICKCITEFNGLLPGEINLSKNDIVQINKVVDKLWLEGEGGGNIGRFPSSVVVKTEIPPHPPDASLYVAVADFQPLQDGDLPLSRGNFVTEIKPVDQDWAYGKSYGREGVFPLNFVWKINMDLFYEAEGSEKSVRMVGKVLTSIRAQLAEELDLCIGDIVTITHIVDDDWYRGECHGKKGIFPRSFIEIIESDVERTDATSVVSTFIEDDHLSHANPISVPTLKSDDKTELVSQNVIVSTRTSKEENGHNSHKVKKSWKELDIKDEDLFTDDYFKLNMPSIYSSTTKPTNKEEFSSNTLDSNDKTANEGTEVLLPLDSLSAKIEEYFDDDSNKVLETRIVNQDLIDIDFAYTEDNTGINPYGRAVFAFTAQYTNELTFRKGDIIHLIRHIDSHWTVGKLGIAKGIFPTSYIDIIVDCPYKAEDAFDKRSDSSFSKKAIVCFDYEATTNPEDASAREGEVVLIIKFVSENWVEIETVDGECGLFPLNHLNVLEEDHTLSDEITDKSSVKSTKRNYEKNDFSSHKKDDIETALSKNLFSLDVSCKHSKPVLNPTKQTSDIFEENLPSETDETEEPLILEIKAAAYVEGEFSFDKDHKSVKHVAKRDSRDDHQLPAVPPRTSLTKELSEETKVVLPSKPSSRKSNEDGQETSHTIEHSVQKVTPAKGISEETNFKSTDFPEDISSSSLSQHSDSVTCKDSVPSALNPQRPAPPPPLRHSDSENEEEFYSLSSETEEVVSVRDEGEEEEEKAEKLEGDLLERKETRGRKKRHLKRESVNELVTTEHEYIHDLESLIQVVRLGNSKKEAASVDLKLLMGNIEQVVELSKKFLRGLNTVSYNEDEDLMIGPVFINMADEMCDVYKIYSANNSISVGPLLKKYQEEGSSAVFLNWILTELRQHKVNLLDMQAVLIKPVQRVLKYPLFIDNLVHNTPTSHADYKNLEDAKKKMLNVAKEINEYTKRLDLVAKYRQSSHHSFGEMIQRVSMRSVAKKGSRIRTRISATMGLINKTKDLRFEEEEAKFRAVVKASAAVAEQGHKLVEVVRGRNNAELGIVEAVASALLRESKNPQIDALRNTCRDTCNRILPLFERIAMKRVVEPTKTLLGMCSAPDYLIQKRYDKLLDFDKAQHKLDKNKDPSRTRILEEELKQAQGTYEALNMQLLMDLPHLNEHGTEVLVLATRSLISARMNLEGHVANLYLKLAQLPAFSYLNNEEYLKNFKTEYTSLMNILKKFSFVVPEFAPKSPRFGRRKSSLKRSLIKRENKKKISVEKVPEKEALLERYEVPMLYIVTADYTAEEPFELSLRQGAIVGVIKMKDPLGSARRWYVDDGDQKGFVKSCCLQKYDGVVVPYPSNDRGQSAATRESLSQDQTSSQGATANCQEVPVQSFRGRDSYPPGNTRGKDELPPRYEDLFPFVSASQKEKEDLGGKEENIYEEIDQVSCGRNVNSNESQEEEVHIYEPVPAEASEEPSAKKQIFFPEPDDDESRFYYSLYHFGGGDSNQLPLHEGQVVLLLFAQGSEWWFVEDRERRRGYVPAAYLSKYT